MSGIVAQPVGITSPPIDDLLEHVDSKYALVILPRSVLVRLTPTTCSFSRT